MIESQREKILAQSKENFLIPGHCLTQGPDIVLATNKQRFIVCGEKSTVEYIALDRVKICHLSNACCILEKEILGR